MAVCVALGATLTGCYDEMGSKSSVDAAYADSSAPELSISNLEVLGYEGFVADVNVSYVDGVIETGVAISTTADFAGEVTFKQPAEITTAFTVEATGIKDGLLYYVKPYAVTAGGLFYGDAVTADVPVAPVFANTYVFGKYKACDYDLQTDEPDGDPYAMVVSPGKLWNEVIFTNLWAGKMSVVAVANNEDNTMYIKAGEVCGIDSDYGPVQVQGLAITDEGKLALAETTSVIYDEEQIVIGYWGARVSAGFFGYLYTVLDKVTE